MDNHPIPQDVTGFQFRLIGDMTIKQFAYLAAGVVFAWIALSTPVFFLFKLPFVVFFAGIGIIFAFIPIAGRPADTMILYFFRAVFSPTQYQYQGAGSVPPTAVAGTNAPERKEKKEEKREEKVQLTQAFDIHAFDQQLAKNKEEAVQQPTAPVAPVLAMPVQQDDTTQDQIAQETVALNSELAEAKREEEEAKNKEEANAAHAKVTELESEMQNILTQKQVLEKKLLELQKQIQQKPQQIFTPTTATAQEATQNVRKVPATLSKSIGAPLMSDTPNLIAGVVKDARGNVLPNILIEVKDKDENPVRAFKTNPLGQFASATPVINGVYTISFEDPNAKQRFDSVELTANGTTLDPLEVISIDAREDLRKELFGG